MASVEPVQSGDIIVESVVPEPSVYLIMVGPDGKLWRWYLNAKVSPLAVVHGGGEFGTAYYKLGNIAEMIHNGIHKAGDVGR